MNNFNITSAQYHASLSGENASITATINGEILCVPLDPDNVHYAEILKQVKEGTLTIKDAD
tara:strand:+ start:394 stop:576 length:183 start_codon:yes stop_codon:yes gene_type:complete